MILDAGRALESVRTVLDGHRGRWWLGGGWAIDGWLGRTTRAHHDVDVVVLRAELGFLRAHLEDWTIWINEPDRFLEWDGGPLADGDDCLMARPDDGEVIEWAAFADHPASIELMLERTEGATWMYRRDPRVRDDLSILGTPRSFLAPEVALLYKSAQPDVERNAADFAAALPHLDARQREWLVAALETTAPSHTWLASLRD